MSAEKGWVWKQHHPRRRRVMLCGGVVVGSGLMAGLRLLKEGLFGLFEGFDFVAEILEVAGRADFHGEDFVDDGFEVMQRANGGEWISVQIAIHASDGSKDQCIFDNRQRNTAAKEFSGEPAVRPPKKLTS
jgi:hypothetical protein